MGCRSIENGRAADATGLPVYLEASGERNQSLYEHFGFKTVGVYTLAVEGGDPDAGWAPYEKLFAMVRPPSAVAGVHTSQPGHKASVTPPRPA